MRSRKALAEAPRLYRSLMRAEDSWGKVERWTDGPYATLDQAQQRFTYWRKHYAKARGPQWLVSGDVEMAEVEWEPLS